MVKKTKYQVKWNMDGVEYIVVRCPDGHKNRARKLSDTRMSLTLVCANTTCNKEWRQTLPQIDGLEEPDE